MEQTAGPSSRAGTGAKRLDGSERFRIRRGFLRKSRPKGEDVRGDKWPVVLWTGLIVLAVVPWTSYQNHAHWQRVAWIPFISPPVKLRDVGANLLMYAPWGFFAARSQPGRALPVGIIVALGAALSLATEASQLYSHGRFPSATDVVCNVLGAFAGSMYARRRLRIDDH
jgi:hypothetical protein